MPNEYDIRFGWPDTRRFLAEKNTKQKRQQNENVDAVDYSCLEKPIEHLLRKEVLYVNTVSTFSADSETDSRTIRMWTSISVGLSEHQAWGKHAWLRSDKLLEFRNFCAFAENRLYVSPYGSSTKRSTTEKESDFICPVSNCCHIAKDFEIKLAHHRAHGTWEERETPKMGEVLLFSTIGNAKALEGALMRKNPFLKINELSYEKHLEPDQLLAVKKLILKHENLFRNFCPTTMPYGSNSCANPSKPIKTHELSNLTSKSYFQFNKIIGVENGNLTSLIYFKVQLL